jgi:uncharacterized protein YjiS (DUF1127 family)
MGTSHHGSVAALGGSAQPRGFRAVLDRVRRRHDARRAASQLMRMDAHILCDIGVSRADVLGMLRNPKG